jgi:hypothetical protein
VLGRRKTRREKDGINDQNISKKGIVGAVHDEDLHVVRINRLFYDILRHVDVVAP